MTFFFFFFLTVFSCSRQRRLRCQQHHKRDCGYEENGDRRRCCVALRPYNKNQKNISSAGRAAVGTHTASDIAADFSRCSREIWSRSSWTTIMIAPSLVSFLSLSLFTIWRVYKSDSGARPDIILISRFVVFNSLGQKKTTQRATESFIYQLLASMGRREEEEEKIRRSYPAAREPRGILDSQPYRTHSDNIYRALSLSFSWASPIL